MRCSRTIAAVVLAAVFGGAGALAAANPRPSNPPSPVGQNPGSDNPRLPAGQNQRSDNPHPPVVHNQRPDNSRPPANSNPRPVSAVPSTTKTVAPSRSRTVVPAQNSGQSNSQHNADHGRDSHRSDVRPGVYVPYYDWYGYYYPYEYYGYWPSWDSFGLGSGGQDTSQLRGMANAEQPRPNGGAAIAEQPAADDPHEPKARIDRSNNARANELASKYIGYGDALFAKQKYVEANDRYRKAARSAPQVATVWFREGFALAAMGRCDQAAAAIKRGLALDPAWPTSNFDVGQLFGGNAAAKNARLDALAAAVKDKPADADRLFVLGVFLHFDGQPDRARTIFERAEKIVGNNVGHIEAFMDDDEDE